LAHKRQTAPGDLEAVRAFVNTVDLEDGSEELADPGALVRWLADHELIEAGTEATEVDLRNAIAVREALRRQLLANNGTEPDAGSIDTLRAAARRARVGLDFRADGSHLEPQADGVDGALGRMLSRVHAAQYDGTWSRLKACPWHTCHAAFYDHTKNHSGVWCTMEVCGNRAKAKAYRERHG
jgi:predicted RNA-binding Zn ribbon-like protein